MEEFEVETSLVFTKRLKLRITNGQVTTGDMRVFESEEPYALIIFIETDQHEELRTDILKEDLAREMRAWLEGKYIRHPAALAPARVDEAIMKFIKFAKTPRQEDLILWILSRCEIYPRTPSQPETELIFGGKSLEESDERLLELKHSIENPLARTASIAAARSAQDESHYLTHSERPEQQQRHVLSQSVDMTKEQSLKQRMNFKHGDDLGMFAMSRQLLGKSHTLETLKSTRIKAREGAKQVLQTRNWTSDHWRLCSEIEHARKEIEKRLDDRRRMMETAKARQLQTSDKFRKIKAKITEAQGGNKFITDATEELLTLKKIEQDIEDDILRQRNRVQRGAQQVFWTIAPAGFANRRGHSQKGPVLGMGPLPVKATGSLKDPKIERATMKYYWDSTGRRHLQDVEHNLHSEQSLMSQAMEAIRRAATNITAFKLDLKSVFEQFDTSGDGLLSPVEMAQAFLSMGVKLDVPTMDAIFKHFDPDGSGSVHFGEFVWAFFNRRGLVRKWKRVTQGITPEQIRSMFHAADKNGNGTLNFKEFSKMLKLLKMDMPDEHIRILIDRFDVDGDGEIDLREFLTFIESEQRNFGDGSGPVDGKTVIKGHSLPMPRGKQQQQQQQQISRSPEDHRQESEAAAEVATRPRSAPPRQRGGRENHNVTAPYRLQNAPSQHQHKLEQPEQLDELDLSRGGIRTAPAPAPALLAAPKAQSAKVILPQRHDHSIDDKIGGGGKEMKEEVDVMWMSRMLQAQAEIEGRLGKRYYRNSHNSQSDLATNVSSNNPDTLSK